MNAQVAVKTASGTTRRTSISEVVMQGTVWGSLMCTSTMDKLGKIAYSKPETLYKYKGVPIPPLGMVDDVISVSSVENTQEINKIINTFIESKKLKLSEKKCSRIHVGKNHEQCPEIKVHDHIMKEAEAETYLGDIVDKNGNIKATIENRKKRGQGAVSEIMSILSEIPFGKFKTEVALKLRESMLLNGMLFNSEAWHGLTSANVAALEAVDQQLLRSILNAHSKTTKEFLYLETGTMPIRWIIPQRRINFFKHIMTRKEDEILKKVFLAQKEKPTQGDFVKILLQDLERFGLSYDEVACETMSKPRLRKVLRKKAKELSFEELVVSMQRSTKVQSIRYRQLEAQPYLLSDMTDEEKEMLTAIRSRCIREVKANFPNMHRMCQHCPLSCNNENPLQDTQEHVLDCRMLGGSNVDIDFMHAGVEEQRLLSKEFCRLIQRRSTLVEAADNSASSCCLPGATILDQSIYS